METSVAGTTMRVVAGDVTAPSDAVMALVPVVKVVASPFVPAALLIVATDVLLDVQVTCVVSTCID
ncbi:hypothetical protein ASF16_09360 [Acidovorax sp. Leaf78]|nr:hypothetical protein ASF16_09360 [Acidovorax sp. Leaf78]